MNRRGFLQGIIALGMAPAIVRASSLMPIRVLDAPRIVVWGESEITLLTPQIIANEAFKMLESNLIMTRHVNNAWEKVALNSLNLTVRIWLPNKYL